MVWQKCYLRLGHYKVVQISARRAQQDAPDHTGIYHTLLCRQIWAGPFYCRKLVLEKEYAVKEMKAWHERFLCFLVLNAAVRYVTSLEENLADSAFGELPVHIYAHQQAFWW